MKWKMLVFILRAMANHSKTSKLKKTPLDCAGNELRREKTDIASVSLPTSNNTASLNDHFFLEVSPVSVSLSQVATHDLPP